MTDTNTGFTSDTLKVRGHIPGPDFGRALEIGQAAVAAGYGFELIRKKLEPVKPPPAPPTLPLLDTGAIAFHVNMDVIDDDEVQNFAGVHRP